MTPLLGWKCAQIATNPFARIDHSNTVPAGNGIKFEARAESQKEGSAINHKILDTKYEDDDNHNDDDGGFDDGDRPH